MQAVKSEAIFFLCAVKKSGKVFKKKIKQHSLTTHPNFFLLKPFFINQYTS